MAEFNTNYYDINKTLVAQEPPLTEEEIKERIDKCVSPFFKENFFRYFMLLCREQYDFTLFNFKNSKSATSINNARNDLYECLTNRGEVISIELTQENDAIEIWISANKEAFCYYLFPYDVGVIEV